LTAPKDYAILHYGYANVQDRKIKHDAYLEQKHQLYGSEREHAESIIDKDPHLLPLDIDIKWPIKRKLPD